MITLINPEIVVNLEDILHSTVVEYTDSTCSLHKALRDHCMRLMKCNYPDIRRMASGHWKVSLHNALATIPELKIHMLEYDNVLKMDLLLELCVQYIFDRSLDRAMKQNYHMVAWDDSRYDWTRDFRFD